MFSLENECEYQTTVTEFVEATSPNLLYAVSEPEHF